MPTTKAVAKQSLFRSLLQASLLVFLAGLGYAVMSLPSEAPGLGERVVKNLETSGVSNQVTAVLLNFRGYDTLLEMAVLLLALLGVWSLGGVPEVRDSSPSPVLDKLTRLLIPVLVLVAGYLLWVGSHAPGGAFQAGSVLGAAGVLLLLSGWRLSDRFAGLPLRVLLVTGLSVFVVVGTVLLLTDRLFLEFPTPLAGMLILLIETAATLSIGITLAALFLGDRPVAGSDK